MGVNFFNLGSVHLFRCIFCRKLSKEPKMMSCMHSACYDCLSQNYRNGGVECNGCNAVNYVKDLSAFADQCYARNILRVIQSMEHGEKFVRCVLCNQQLNENQMAFTCISCNPNLADCGDVADHPSASLNSYLDERPLAQFIMCENCFDQHCQQNQDHNVFACVATSNGEQLLDEDARSATCAKHHKSFVTYCMKSRKSMCNSCLKSHNGTGHTHLTIEEVKSVLKGKVDFEERFQTTVKSHSKSAKSLKKSLKIEEQESISNMQKLFVKLREKIDEAEQLLKNRLQGFYSEKVAEIDQVLESSAYFETLGGRLFRTSGDLLSLSSDAEIFTFVSPLSALADQVSSFSAAFEEELRSVLKNKPYMAFNRKAFEELLSVSFATIELQDVPLVDSLCCSVIELVKEQSTQICITSACESGAFIAENFQVELSVPGKASIELPVTLEEHAVKSVVAQVDSKSAVKPGLYKLNVLFRGEVVKNCPSHLRIFPKYCEGLFSKDLKERLDASILTEADEFPELSCNISSTRQEIEDLNLSDTEDVAIDDSASLAPSVSTFVSHDVRRIHTTELDSYQRAPSNPKRASSQVGSFASSLMGKSTIVDNSTEEYQYGNNISSFNAHSISQPSLIESKATSNSIAMSERNNNFPNPTLSTSIETTEFAKPQPIETFQFSAPFSKVRSDDFAGESNADESLNLPRHSSSARSGPPGFRDPAFPPPTIRPNTARRADNTRIQMHHAYASQNPKSKRYYGHVSRCTPWRYPAHVFYSAEYKEALFYEKDIILSERSGRWKQQNVKYFDLPEEVAANLESQRSSRSNQSPRCSPQPAEDDFEMMPDDLGDHETSMLKTPNSGDKGSFLKGTYDKADSSLDASQSQRAKYDELFGMVSEINLDEQIIRVITPGHGQVSNSQGDMNGSTQQSPIVNVPKTKRIKPKPRPITVDPVVQQTGSADDLIEISDLLSSNEDEYKNYYCDRFKFSTVTDAGVSVKKVSRLGIKGKSSSKLGSFSYPIGCAVSRTDEVVICDHGNDRIQIFDINGRFKSTFGSNILVRPSAVVSANNGGFAVRADNGIFFFDKDGTNLPDRNIKSKFSKSCYGLVAHSDDQLMFLNLVKPQGNLVTVNWDGRFVSENVYQPLCSQTRPPKTKCRFMDAYNGYLFVSDLGASRVYITDMEGRTIGIFGSFGSKRDEMNEPAGIKCTENFILVSDSKNHRLKVYGGNGETLSILTFPAGDVIKRPSDICFGSGSILVVNSFLTHEVYVYRIEV